MYWTLVLIGLIGGTLTGLMSVGGGIILMYLLMLIPPFFGHMYTMHTISAMVIIQTLFSGSTGLINYWRNQLVNVFVIRYMGFAIFIGGALGSLFAGTMSDQHILIVFSFLSLAAMATMFSKATPSETLPYENKIIAIILGLGIGILGGLVGLGAGFLCVPVLLNLFKIQPKYAVGTSLFLAIALCSGAFLLNATKFVVPWHEAIFLSIGAILGAQTGSYLNGKIRTQSLRHIMVIAISLVALKNLGAFFQEYGISASTLWFFGISIGGIVCSVILIRVNDLKKKKVNKIPGKGDT